MTPDKLADALAARLDGPHEDDRTAGAAWLAAEAIRYLNYATGSHAAAGLTYPATAYNVTGGLAAAAARLGQLTGQLAAFVCRELAAGRLGEDSGTDPALAAERFRLDLAAAATSASALADALADAQAAISGLHQPSARQTAGRAVDGQQRCGGHGTEFCGPGTHQDSP